VKRPPKPPKIVERKLGREKAAGQCHDDKPLIEIDPRQDPKERLDTLIHELLHHVAPEWTEEHVAKNANIISEALWKQKYRRIEE
jgi:Zn-dependent peptidase ImmA (M78 family)